VKGSSKGRRKVGGKVKEAGLERKLGEVGKKGLIPTYTPLSLDKNKGRGRMDGSLIHMSSKGWLTCPPPIRINF